LTPKHDTLASVAAPDLPAIPALPGPTRAPELAAGAASKPVPADTTEIAAKPPEPGTVEAVTPALTPDIVSTGPPSAPILIKDVPLPRASPRRAALADANAPNATKPTAAKPVVRQRRARRSAQSRQQAPQDGLADLFFGGGKPQQKR
jgi:hypothetical protein